MLKKYVGESELQAFHEEMARLTREGECIYSPGGAAAAVGLTRQRIHQLVQERDDIRAWAYYEDRQRVFLKPKKILAYMYVSMRDLLAYALDTGRIESEDDLGAFSPMLIETLDTVKREKLSSA